MGIMKEHEQGEYLPYCIGHIRQNGIVSTSNRLIRPIELSSNEYKALLYAMAVANLGEKNHQDYEITEQTYIYLYKDHLGELLGLEKKNSVNIAIDRIYKELSSRVAHFIIEEPLEKNKKKTKRVHSVVPIIRELRWEDDAKNALQIRFTSEVLPYFTRLASGNFTNYQLKHLFALDSVMSMNLYSYFLKNDFKYQQEDCYDTEMSLEGLKALIDLGETKYDRWVDFRRYVLDRMLHEINARTDLHLDYKTVKKGRPIVGIIFTVTRQKIELPVVDPVHIKQYLDVPFEDNMQVKELGAKFDKQGKAWFIYSDDAKFEHFQKWMIRTGCSTDSQANLVVNDASFQMDFAEVGMSLKEFKTKMKAQLKNDQTFVQQHQKTLNDIFGADVV
mgnify:FL=1